MRECGLKHCKMFASEEVVQSLPMRECGLKLANNGHHLCITDVTPHAGVWIETPVLAWGGQCSVVTPHAGALIETLKSV